MAQPPRGESYLGNLAPVARSIQQEAGYSLSYEKRGAATVEEWRRRGRAAVERTLSYAPAPVPLDMRVESTVRGNGYDLRTISFAGSPHYRIPAFLLTPTAGKPPYPAVVALHDHGAYFYHGKEKLVEVKNEHPALTAFKKEYYGGRSYASELARRGFVVLVIDAFYWGERRLQYREPPRELARLLSGLDPAQAAYVKAVNAYNRQRVYELNTWLNYCGTSWMGIVNYDDRRSVDLLASLPEVDRARMGCVGLSGGGFRSTYLAGMDSRIRAAVIVGWMTSLPTTLDIPYSVHSGMLDAFGLHRSLDHPDVAALGAPDCAIFVQNCGRDELFTTAGMAAAAEKIRRVFADMKKPERFRVQVYDVPHQFNAVMQDDAFEWLTRWLR
ncbi:MAG: hypothetical protein U0Q18_04585 [Bryobacteraceae bacterium]